MGAVPNRVFDAAGRKSWQMTQAIEASPAFTVDITSGLKFRSLDLR